MKKFNLQLVIGLVAIMTIGVLNFKYAGEGYGNALNKVAAGATAGDGTTAKIITTIVANLDDLANILKGENKTTVSFDCRVFSRDFYAYHDKYNPVTGKYERVLEFVGSQSNICGKFGPEPREGNPREWKLISGSVQSVSNVTCAGYGAFCSPKIWNISELCSHCN